MSGTPFNPFSLNNVYDTQYKHLAKKCEPLKGWQTVSIPSCVERVNAEYRITTSNRPIDYEFLKQNLYQSIITELARKNLLKLEKFERVYEPMATSYVASMFVVKPSEYNNISTVINDMPIFKVGNETFTNEELIEAVKYKFPERFV